MYTDWRFELALGITFSSPCLCVWFWPNDFRSATRQNDSPNKMKPENKSAQSGKKTDRTAYIGMAIYALINVAWIMWAFSGAGFAIFYSAPLIGIVVPVVGLLCLILFQCTSRERRFSLRANVLSVLTVVGWFFAVCAVVAAASASV